MTKTLKNLLLLALVLLVILGGIFYYQNSKKENAMLGPAAVPAQTVASVQGCYVAKLSKDVYTLTIQSQDSLVLKGTLAFKNFEKDSSSGTFSGILSGDTLIGTYSFDSEGMHSNRQVVFKKVGDTFVEGFGDVKTSGDTESFVNINAVTFDPNSTFVKSATCTQ